MIIQYFIFDWSGTISDDRRSVYEANMLMYKDFGIEAVSFDRWLGTVSMSVSEAFRELGVDVSLDEIDRVYKKRLNEVIDNGVKPSMYPDAKVVLEQIINSGKRVSILSAHPITNLNNEAKEYGLYGLVDELIGDTRDKESGLKNLVGKLNLDPARTIYIGDTIRDIQSTKSAGLISGGITTGYHSQEALEAAKPDHLFNSLTELNDLIK